MPIKPENKKLYPKNWQQLRDQVRFKWAQGKCQKCGRIHRQRLLFSPGQIVLAAAHLNQDPTDNRKSNLRALCQRCYLAHDRKDNLAKSHLTRATRKDATRPLLSKGNENENEGTK